MKRKRPKGGWRRRAELLLCTLAEDQGPMFIIGVAAVCARNRLAVREASPDVMRALLAVDPVLWLPGRKMYDPESYNQLATWELNFGAPLPITRSRGGALFVIWWEVAQSSISMLDAQRRRATVKRLCGTNDDTA